MEREVEHPHHTPKMSQQMPSPVQGTPGAPPQYVSSLISLIFTHLTVQLMVEVQNNMEKANRGYLSL